MNRKQLGTTSLWKSKAANAVLGGGEQNQPEQNADLRFPAINHPVSVSISCVYLQKPAPTLIDLGSPGGVFSRLTSLLCWR